MRQRLVARVGLLAMRTQARNQRHALLQWPVVIAGVRQHLDELIADLDRRVAALEAEIAAALAGSAWAEPLECLTSAPGIGLVTASWLLVSTLNFALCTGPEALTADVGLAPVPRESGRRVRGRPHIGHDGNARLRTALSMATRIRQAAEGRALRRRPQAAPPGLGARQQAPTLRPGPQTTTTRRSDRAGRSTDEYRI